MRDRYRKAFNGLVILSIPVSGGGDRYPAGILHAYFFHFLQLTHQCGNAQGMIEREQNWDIEQ